MATQRPLTGIRVVEVARGRTVGAAGTLLMELGASVICCVTSAAAGVDDPVTARLYENGKALWRCGNESVVAALAGAESGSTASTMEASELYPPLARADLLLCDLAPDADALVALRAALPQLCIACAPTGFAWADSAASDAPFDYALVEEDAFFAASGAALTLRTNADQPPPGLGVEQGARASAAALSSAGLVALLQRERTGTAGMTSVTVRHCGMYSIANDLSAALADGLQPPLWDRTRPISPMGNLYECADGWLLLGVATAAGDDVWQRFVQALGKPDWASHAEYGSVSLRRDNMRALIEHLDVTMRTQTRSAWVSAFAMHKISATPIPTPKDVLQDEQLWASGILQASARQPDRAARVAGPIVVAEVDSVPCVDEQAGTLTSAELEGYWPDRASAAGSAVGARAQSIDEAPLTGLRVVELSNFVAAPGAATMLAELGAEVVKIEPITGDPRRASLAARPKDDPVEFNRSFEMDNAGKRGVALALDQEEGRQLAQQLAASADVVLTNLLPGRQIRFGLDAQTLQKLRPGLVHVTLTAHGMVGPAADVGGFDLTAFFARSGISSVLSDDQGVPPRSRSGQGDHITALVLTLAVLAGINAQRHGRTTTTMTTSLLATGSFTNARALLAANSEPGSDSVRARTFLAADNVWFRVPMTAAGLSKLLARASAAPQSLFASERFEHWQQWFAERGIGVTAVATLPAAIAAAQDTEVLARQVVTKSASAPDGLRLPTEVPVIASPIRWRAVPDTPLPPAPALGQDTTAVLRAVGMTDLEIDQLRAENICR